MQGCLDILSNVQRTDELTKLDRDTLLAVSGASKINISINLDCSVDECKWSASQAGLINTRDNVMPTYRMNCTVTNQTTNECITEVRIDYTTNELLDQAQAQIKTRLENYADATRQRAIAKVPKADGNIVFNEK